MERLEHEADTAGAQAGTGVFIELVEVLAQQNYFSRRGLIESCQQTEQGRFAGTRRTRDGQDLAGFDVKLDFAEDGERAVSRGDPL